MTGPSEILWNNAPLLLQGALSTLSLWFSACLVSTGLGVVFGSITNKRFVIPIISSVIKLFTFVIRAIPFYVNLLIIYFVVPDLLLIEMSPFAAGVVALGICSGSYATQIIAGGIDAIPDGQWESAYLLGYGTVTTLKDIIFPQVFYAILPALIGEQEQLVKSTSILSVIGYAELTRVGMNIVAEEMVPVTIYCAIACLYLSMSIILKVFHFLIHKRIQH